MFVANCFHVSSVLKTQTYTLPLWSCVQRKGLGGWWILYVTMSFPSSLLNCSDPTQNFRSGWWTMIFGTQMHRKATKWHSNIPGYRKTPLQIIPSTGSQQLREPCISELVRCGKGGRKQWKFRGWWGGGQKQKKNFHLAKCLVCRVLVQKGLVLMVIKGAHFLESFEVERSFLPDKELTCCLTVLRLLWLFSFGQNQLPADFPCAKTGGWACAEGYGGNKSITCHVDRCLGHGIWIWFRNQRLLTYEVCAPLEGR